MTRLKLWLGAAVAALLAFWAVWTAGRREGHQNAATRALQAEVERDRRMDDADTHGAGDDDNVRFMRDFAARNRR